MMYARLLLTLSAVAMLSTPGLAAPKTFNCEQLKKSTVTVDTNLDVTTISDRLHAINSSTTNFTIAGTTNSCVLVDISVQVSAPGAKVPFLRLVPGLDCGPIELDPSDGPVRFLSDSDKGIAHSYSFIFPDVPPGPCSAVILIASSVQDTKVTLHEYHMEIRHR